MSDTRSPRDDGGHSRPAGPRVDGLHLLRAHGMVTLASTRAALEAWGHLNAEATSAFRRVIEAGMSAFPALMGARNPLEAVLLHGDLTRTLFDDVVARSGLYADLGALVLKSALAPTLARLPALGGDERA